MAVEAYRFRRDVKKDEWNALQRDFKQGEIVYRFRGHTYGLDRDDLMYLGVSTVPCKLTEDEGGFFTVPVDMLETLDGKPVLGDYIKIPRGGLKS